MHDQQIVELYWQRSEEAIRATADKYGPYCRAVARRILPDPRDTEECLNDAWIRTWNAIPPHRPSRLRLFLGKITRRAACDALRASAAQKRGGGAYTAALEELGECVPASPGADQAVLDRELEELVCRFLRGLPARACNIFLRRYWYVEPLEDIASRYGMNVNTVKTSLYRTRGKLRSYLEKEGILL